MAETSIEWATKVWNPVVGCSVISPGCTNCYAMRMAGRLERMGSAIYKGLTQKTKAGDVWTGRVEASNWGKMIEPLRWKKPERIFVNSMSDLFHENLDEGVIYQVFAVMALCPQHTFMVLTKRADRMRGYCSQDGIAERIWRAADTVACDVYLKENHPSGAYLMAGPDAAPWPLPNVWLGVSAEDQERADLRIPDLLETPAAKRFVSAEPLLGPIDFRPYMPNRLWNNLPSWKQPELDLVIVGGESGPKSRDFRLSWARSIVGHCRDAEVPCFVKQLGANAWDDISYVGATPPFKMRDRKGGDMSEWPVDLRVRVMPR